MSPRRFPAPPRNGSPPRPSAPSPWRSPTGPGRHGSAASGAPRGRSLPCVVLHVRLRSAAARGVCLRRRVCRRQGSVSFPRRALCSVRWMDRDPVVQASADGHSSGFQILPVTKKSRRRCSLAGRRVHGVFSFLSGKDSGALSSLGCRATELHTAENLQLPLDSPKLNC